MNSPEFHFIISAPRSGSTWLTAALNQHPEIFATEQRLFGQFCEMWPNNNGTLAPRITFDSYVRAFSVHYFQNQYFESREQFEAEFIADYVRFLAEFARNKSGKRILMDKITPYPGTAKTVIRQLQHYFPDAKIFKLVRDGRDVATSGVFDWLLKDAHGVPRYQVFVDQRTDVDMPRFFDDAALEKWSKNWRETIEIFETQKPYMTVRFEDMLTDQPDVLMKMFSELQVESTNSIAQQCAVAVTFEKSTGRSRGAAIPTSKQRSGTSGDWKKYFTKQDGELFHSLAGQQLIDEGYAANADWVQRLPERLSIVPDHLQDGVFKS